jgi:hypothetical protein
MAYMVAWGIYAVMAVLLMLAYERYIVPLLMDWRQFRLFLRALMAILLFTPGVVLHEEGIYIVPACVGVMFNILAHKPLAILQAALPLLLVATLVFGVLFFWDIKRGTSRAE